MIAVDEARNLVKSHTPAPQSRIIPLHQAVHHVLAADIYATNAFPPFHQSAMDGYAFRFEDYAKGNIQIDGEVAAGDQAGILPFGTAKRIFTGAQVPAGADTVVMQEHVRVENGSLIFLQNKLQPGSNVRLKGSQIEAGEVAFEKGSFLNAAAIGFIASLGLDMVRVYSRPRVHIIVTGSELIPPGEQLPEGKIYESNSFMLMAALKAIDYEPDGIHFIRDDAAALPNLLDKLNPVCDVFLLTGGVSIGDYDFVGKSQHLPGFETIFHKVRQKPGKPFLFATYKGKLLFGLPGNPASVLSCFYQYVLPSLRQSSGLGQTDLLKERVPLSGGFTKKAGLTVFLKGKCADGRVHILPQQESYILRSYAQANCLIELEEDRELWEAGDEVTIHHLPKANY
jgi:molybdopterin molybdotransferase